MGGEGKQAKPRRGRWSQQEIARLRELYGLRELALIARELGRPQASVRKMAESLYPVRRRTGPWTSGEVLELKRYLGASDPETIARILGRTLDEVQGRIELLGKIERTGRWTREELSDLKRLYGTRTDEDLSRIFGRSLEAIREQASRLSLAKDKAFLRRLNGSEGAVRMPRWTDEELELLRELYPDQPNLDIARRLDRSVKSIVSKAHNLGLKKSANRLREMGRENVSLRYEE
jgi:hypothetical protein